MLQMRSPEPDLDASRAESSRLTLALQIALILIGVAALVGPLWIIAKAPRITAKAEAVAAATGPKRVIPKTELPTVDPVETVKGVTPDDARAINAAVPFSTAPNPAARPFHIFGAADDQERAIDCLAAAVYYEAGDDAVGEEAVAQVVINRVRHPAFPKSVCGVVFQGSERSTGCQFTFSCDGAMGRTPSEAAWGRARYVARTALNGSVDKPIGHATHYHTDWVVPYWSSSLEKITEVHTHLFFRWAGWWGTPPAFNRGYAGVEPVVAALGRLSPVHAVGGVGGGEFGAMPVTGFTVVDPATIDVTAIPKAMSSDPNVFMVTLDKKMGADTFAALAIRTCGDRTYCKFMAWSDPKKTPAALPLNANQVAAMSFSYLRDQSLGFAKALWNCDEYRRPSPVQCMRAQMLAKPALPAVPMPDLTKAAVPVAAVTIPAPQATAAPGAAPLTGVRRKEVPPPVSFTLPPAQPAPAAPKAPQQDNR